MAMAFNGSTQYLNCVSPPPSFNGGTQIFTMFVRIKPTTIGTTQVYAAMTETSFFNGILMAIVGASDANFQKFATTVATVPAITAAGVWKSHAGRSFSITSDDLTVDAANATGSGTAPANTAGTLTIGARLIPALNLPANGSAACFAFWNAALDNNEIQSLVKGISPRRIRPQSLGAYYPLLRDLTAPLCKFTALRPTALVNVGGATVADHPRSYGM